MPRPKALILAALAPLLALALAACVPETAGAPVSRPAPGGAAGGAAGQCLGAPAFEAPPLNACAGPTARLALVGDVLLHTQLQALGYRIGFGNVWAQPARFLRAADIAVANLEGPVAPGVTRARVPGADPGPVADGEVYTGFPQFNYHPVVLRDLKAAGIDIITTANNHAMDRGPLGVDLTLAEAARAGLAAVGSVARGAPRGFVLRRSSPVGTLAFIACSFSTNGLPDPDRQVLGCYGQRRQLLDLVRREAADPSVAGVIVLPHWGTEYRTAPDGMQQALARDLVAAGATAVVGTHPHAVQPIVALAGPRGARVPVVYSTGNFVATQGFVPSKYEALALVDLCRGAGGKAVAARVGWIAMEMNLTARGYWANIAPRGATGPAGAAERFLRQVAPGYGAQPPACGG